MAEPSPHKPTPLVARAQRLVAVSMAGPLIFFLAVIAVLVLYGRPHSAEFVFIGVGGMILLVWLAWVGYWGDRENPYVWTGNSIAAGWFNVIVFLPTMLSSRDDLRVQLDTQTFAVAVVVLTVGIFLIGWLPARQATHMIFDDLPPDVVNSSLVILFRSRVRSVGSLKVAPDSIAFKWRQVKDVKEASYPLTDVSEIGMRTEEHNGEFRVPGAAGGKIPVKAGEVLVIALPDGPLVYPVRDGHRAKRFIEDRRAAVLAE